MKHRHELPLSIVGCIGMALELAPLMTLLTALFQRPAAENLFRLACLTAAGLAGYLISLRLRRTALPPILQWGCLLLSGALLGWGAALMLGQGLLERCLLGGLLLFGHFWCSAAAGRPFGNLLTMRTMARIAGFYGAFLPILWAVEKLHPVPYSHLPNAICFLLIAACGALIWNQSSIDDLTASRHYSLESLPRQIRPYNLGLVVLVILLTALLFCGLLLFSAHGEELLGLLREWILELLRSMSAAPEEAPPVLTENAPPSGGMELPIDSGEGLSLAWLGALIKWGMALLGIGGVLAVVLYNRNQILDWFRRLWLSLSGMTLRLFRSGRQEHSDGEYTDASQSLLLEDRPAAALRQDRRWRREVRGFGRMADSPEKYRLGYRLLMEGLLLSGLPIRASDTPRDVSRKAEPVLPEKDLGESTNGYQLLRYACRENQPQGLRALSSLLELLRKEHRHRK